MLLAALATALGSSLFHHAQATDCVDRCDAEPLADFDEELGDLGDDDDDDGPLQAWERAEVSALRVDLIQTMVTIQKGVRAQDRQARAPAAPAASGVHADLAVTADEVADEAIAAADQGGALASERRPGRAAEPLESGTETLRSGPQVQALATEARVVGHDGATPAHVAAAPQAHSHAAKGRGRRRDSGRAVGLAEAAGRPAHREVAEDGIAARKASEEDDIEKGLADANSADAEDDLVEAVSLMETGMTLVKGERAEDVLTDAGGRSYGAAAAGGAPDIADALAEEARVAGSIRFALGFGVLVVAAGLSAWAGSAAAQARPRLKAVDSLVAHSAERWKPPTAKSSGMTIPPKICKEMAGLDETPIDLPPVKGWSAGAVADTAPSSMAEPAGEPCPEPLPEPTPQAMELVVEPC